MRMARYVFTNASGTFYSSPYVGWYGKPTKRTPYTHRYSYEPYFLYRADTFDPYTMSGHYSDRMWQWDSAKFSRCVNDVWPDSHHGQYFSGDSPEDIKRFLELYFGYPVVLHGVLEGCNVSSGYPYWIFVFTKEEVG